MAAASNKQNGFLTFPLSRSDSKNKLHQKPVGQPTSAQETAVDTKTIDAQMALLTILTKIAKGL